MRKTFNVSEFVDSCNVMFANSTCTPEERQGVITILGDLLHKTGNYRGYNYLRAADIPAGQRPGVNYEVNASGISVPCADYDKRFDNTDRTRVRYY